ncbi:hexose kinase [Enterococcus sp. BWB1-3]|uniref:hexose kinase n=1 Tax=Enterococcus sp. BWB1-3 TaxID=2787713 RepID=UPI001922F959|nr:hexose kinase [Enterococcus sp. BWB1-3]MBL1228676.1 hexose kinase [Enterococcus sp. BWB1-3]
MILTVTMNPSVDMSYSLEHFKLDDVNRVSEVSKTAGGKGLNVSRVLHQLDRELLATGVLGGFLGAYIELELEKEGILHDFTKIKEESRNSIAVLHDQGQQTEILEKGPTVTKQEEQTFIEHFKVLVKKSRLVTISGSLAAGLSQNLYDTLIGLAKEAKVSVLLDTSGNALKQAVISENKPFLIKPNETEIAELLSVEKAEGEELLEQLKHPMFDGIDWIVVSLGAAGAIAKHKEKFYKVRIPALEAVNPVGSGDATLAGLAYAVAAENTDEDVLKWGMTTGMLNALEIKTGWIDPNKIDDYFGQIVVTQL